MKFRDGFTEKHYTAFPDFTRYCMEASPNIIIAFIFLKRVSKHPPHQLEKKRQQMAGSKKLLKQSLPNSLKRHIIPDREDTAQARSISNMKTCWHVSHCDESLAFGWIFVQQFHRSEKGKPSALMSHTPTYQSFPLTWGVREISAKLLILFTTM